jgi:transcriptional regulator with XRE-family HTH domain
MRYCAAGMERIKAVRHRLGVSLTELSQRTGMHRMALARVERAGMDARASTVAAIARALKVPVCELFDAKDIRHGKR